LFILIFNCSFKIQQIIKPLENETWISHADHNDMFGRIPWLSNLHICLTSELKSALNHPEEKSLGNCFSCVVSNTRYH